MPLLTSTRLPERCSYRVADSIAVLLALSFLRSRPPKRSRITSHIGAKRFPGHLQKLCRQLEGNLSETLIKHHFPLLYHASLNEITLGNQSHPSLPGTRPSEEQNVLRPPRWEVNSKPRVSHLEHPKHRQGRTLRYRFTVALQRKYRLQMHPYRTLDADKLPRS